VDNSYVLNLAISKIQWLALYRNTAVVEPAHLFLPSLFWLQVVHLTVRQSRAKYHRQVILLDKLSKDVFNLWLGGLLFFLVSKEVPHSNC